MLNPQPRNRTAPWYDRLDIDEAMEVDNLEKIMAGLEEAYRLASERRAFLQRRAHGRTMDRAARREQQAQRDARKAEETRLARVGRKNTARRIRYAEKVLERSLGGS